ncbi:MAG: hypothetical protein Q9175_000087 [Cornicularia normoerica]
MSMSRDPLLEDFSVEESDKISYEPSTDSTDGKTQDYLIYFIPGNPGLIQFYQPFLSKLHILLSKLSTTESSKFHICGHSLRGFESAQDDKKVQIPRYPLGLEQQIKAQERLLYEYVRSHRNRTGNNPKVILMGHSVGCYLLLELIRQHRDKIEEGEEDFDLIGGILLFPTITDIAKSPLGMVFGVCVFDPEPGSQLNLASNPENSPNTVPSSNHRHHREDLVVAGSGELPTMACQAGHQFPRVRSSNHNLVHQKPDGS